jgi:hypothetical protein
LKSFLELLVLATIVLKKGIKIILITKKVNDTIPIVIEIKKELEIPNVI